MGAPFLNVNDVIQTTVYCQGNSQVTTNAFYWRVTAKTLDPTLLIFAEAMSGEFAAVYRPLMGTEAAYLGLIAKRIVPTPQSDPIATVVAAGAGTGGDGLLPTQVRGIFTKLTGVAGRAHRGRTYVPFPPRAAQDGASEKPTDVYVGKLADLATFATFTHSDIGDGTNKVAIQPVLARSNGALENIADFTVRQKWATQRRSGDYGNVFVSPV